jgi:lysozyme
MEIAFTLDKQIVSMEEVDRCRTQGTGKALRSGDIATLRAKLALFINQNGKPLLGLRRRTAGRLALFDGKPWQEAEAIGRAVK